MWSLFTVILQMIIERKGENPANNTDLVIIHRCLQLLLNAQINSALFDHTLYRMFHRKSSYSV